MGFDERRIPSLLLVGPPCGVRTGTLRSRLLARLGLRRFSSPIGLLESLDLHRVSAVMGALPCGW